MKIEIDRRVIIAMDVLSGEEKEKVNRFLLAFPENIQNVAKEVVEIGDFLAYPFSKSLVLIFERTEEGYYLSDIMNKRFIAG